MSYITPELQLTLVERARQYYSDELPYHNWAHAEDVMNNIASLALQSTSLEVIEDTPLAVITGAWHDVQYHERDMRGYATKEQRSATLALRNLPELTNHDRYRLASAIIDTTVAKTQKDSTLGKLVTAGDTGYFAAPYPRFTNRLSLMVEEWGDVSWEQAVERTVKFGNFLIGEEAKNLPDFLPAAVIQARFETIRSNLDTLQNDNTLAA